MEVFEILVGFDPHPLKVGWTLVALAAIVYSGKNLRKAIAELRWALQNTPEPYQRERRTGIAHANIDLHRWLAIGSVAGFLAGVASMLSPSSQARPDQPVTLGLLLAPLCLVIVMASFMVVGYRYNRSRTRLAEAAYLMSERIRSATKAQLEREQAGNPPGLVIKEEPLATIEVQLDVQVVRPATDPPETE